MLRTTAITATAILRARITRATAIGARSRLLHFFCSVAVFVVVGVIFRGVLVDFFCDLLCFFGSVLVVVHGATLASLEDRFLVVVTVSGQRRLVAQLDLAEVVDVEHLHLEAVSDADDVRHRVDELVGQLGHMAQAFLPGQDLDEATEVLDRGHPSGVELAGLYFPGHVADVGSAGLSRLGVEAADVDQTRVVDRNLDTVVGLQRADVLARWADDEANLLDWYLHRQDARSVRADVRTRPGQCTQHLLQDVQATLPGLLERLGEKILGQAIALDVHLQGGEALAGARDLEVHVTAVVFRAEDVGQDLVFLALHDEAHRDASHRLTQRDTRVHQGQRATAHRRHRRRAVRLQDLGGHAHRVWKLLPAREKAFDRTLCQRAVTDLAATGPHHPTHFTDAERREGVMQHEVLRIFLIDPIAILTVVDGAQSRDAQRLGLAPSEQHRTVDAREHADFDGDLADRLRVAAIRTPTLEDRLALGFLLDVIAHAVDVLLVLLLVGAFGCRERFVRLLAHSLARSRPLVLVALGAHGLLEVRCEFLRDRGVEFLIPFRGSELHLLLACLLDESGHELRDLGADVLAAAQRFEDDIFLHLVRTGFHHHDGVLVTREGQREIVLRRLHLGPGRIDDELAVDHADAARTEVFLVRDRADRQRGERADRGDDVRFGLHVGGQHLGENLALLLEPIGEQRTDRPVDDPTGQDLAVGRTTFALEEPSREPTRGGIPLAIVDGQREEIDVVAGLRALRRREHHRVAVAGDDRAVSLLRHAPSLEREGPAPDFAGYAHHLPVDLYVDLGTRGAVSVLLLRRLSGRLLLLRTLLLRGASAPSCLLFHYVSFRGLCSAL